MRYLSMAACLALALAAVLTNYLAIGVPGYFPPYIPQQPYQWPQPMTQQVQAPVWPMQRPVTPQIQLQDPGNQRSPAQPGSPMWKRLQFMKRYNAMQRSRDSSVYSDPVSKGSPSKFEERSLSYHNGHRHLHSSGSLKLDHKMSLQAAKFAKSLAKSMRVKHSDENTRKGQNENIAVGCKLCGPGLTAFEATKYWYQTVCHNSWIRPGSNEKSRPFTNMVWRSSQNFGIGQASFKTKGGYNCTIMVARYSPGRGKGEASDFMRNVLQGHFIPTACQYNNDLDKPDFIQPSMKCKGETKDFHGQMVAQDSSCTIADLFAVFGASKRKGKLAFRVVL